MFLISSYGTLPFPTALLHSLLKFRCKLVIVLKTGDLEF
jgi:hypothetical protein